MINDLSEPYLALRTCWKHWYILCILLWLHIHIYITFFGPTDSGGSSY